jgi:hypothetical protein
LKSKLILFAFACYLNITPCFADQLIVNLSTGYEKITSPLVRIDIDSPLILVEGRTKLSGQYYLLNFNGVKDWEFNNETSVDFSTLAYIKEAPKADDLNFSTLSFDTNLRKNLKQFHIGFGPSIQRVWVANQTFRDNILLQSDLTYTNMHGGFTNFYFALAKSIYVEEFDFFDSNTVTASFTHHINDVGLGFSALDLQLNASRERNTKDFDDLSNSAYYGRISIDRLMFGLTWSGGVSITKSSFDAPFFEGFDKRSDTYVSYEFGLERKISEKFQLNLDFNKAKNSSNLALFESDYHSVNLSLNFTY